jgi:hypothetical protein
VPTEKNNPDKVQEIFDYLMIEFPDSSLGHKYDGRRRVETFQLQYQKKQFLISFSSEFLNDNSSKEIPLKLKQFQLAESIRQSKAPLILVTNSGLKFES